ncbi:hypothetical protein GLI01_28660 [Gluconacetobacter liquefaciens]|nr:hypothetical protein GLI01_28660 [Gluconacetobacter liquefaciens]
MEQASDGDFVREMLAFSAGRMRDMEGGAGASPGARSAPRTAQRNGWRARCWDTRAATVELAIPKHDGRQWVKGAPIADGTARWVKPALKPRFLGLPFGSRP